MARHTFDLGGRRSVSAGPSPARSYGRLQRDVLS